MLVGQSKRDYTWVLGYSTLIPGMPDNEKFGGMKLDFTSKIPSVETFDLYTMGVSGVANDEEGNLQFYTSGCQIFNKNNEVMEGGEDITIGGNNASWRCAEMYPSLLNLWGSTVILPLPDHNDKYLVFQLRLIETPELGVLYDHYFYSEVDMSQNDGLGKVMKTGQIVLSDSLHDAVAAVRHGNGRDWWVVVPRGTERQFWEILVTPDGVQPPVLQTLPRQAPFTLTWQDADPPFAEHPVDEYMFESWSGQANFSPDGSRYARIVAGNGVEIMDFDRCTGEMVFRKAIPMPPDSNFIKAGQYVQFCGLAISPNNRYLYFSNNLGLFQLDMCAEGFEKAEYKKIGYWDGFYQDSPSPFGSNFFHMINAPDGKIYINSSNTVRSFHTINNPNVYGEGCDFKQRSLSLPRWNNILLNYFPNFRLYDLAGSPCDTLHIDDPDPPKPPVTFDEFKLFPNPADQQISLYIPQCETIKIKVWGIPGQKALEIPFVPGMEVFPIDVSTWPAGAYILAAYIDDKKPIMKKFVVAH